MKLENIEFVRDCLENTDKEGRREIKKIDKLITPKLAKIILNAFDHLTIPAFLSLLKEKQS